MTRALVWDLPVRLLHWLLALGFGGALLLASLADDGGRIFPLHAIFGLVAVLVVLLRIAWGFIGSRPARFTSFDLRLSSLRRYAGAVATGQLEPTRGHNPATAWFALALFAVLLATGASGLANARGIEAAGELHEVLPWVAAALVALHLAGLALHTIRHRENVADAMIRGTARVEPSYATRTQSGGVAIALLLVVGAAGAALFSAWNPAAGSIDLPFGVDLQIGENQSEEDGRRAAENEEEHESRDVP